MLFLFLDRINRIDPDKLEAFIEKKYPSRKDLQVSLGNVHINKYNCNVSKNDLKSHLLNKKKFSDISL